MAAAIGVAVLTGLLAATGHAAAAGSSSTTASAAGSHVLWQQPHGRAAVTAARIAIRSGTLHLQGGHHANLVLSRPDDAGDQSCRLSIQQIGTILIITDAVRAAPGRTADPCTYDLTLTLQPRTDLDLRVGSGHVTITGMRGAIAFDIGKGDLAMQGVNTVHVRGKTGIGNVSIAGGTLKDSEFVLGAGDLSLAMPRMPESGHCDLQLGSGHATLSLPKEARLSARFSASNGTLTNAFASQAQAPFTISASAGSGNLEIKKL